MPLFLSCLSLILMTASVSAGGPSGSVPSFPSIRCNISPHSPSIFLPKVEAITSTDGVRIQLVKSDEANDKEDFVAVFSAPAHFPVPGDGYGSNSSEAVIIYEGMSFKARKDGIYEVKFIIESPTIPVTLRMQLVVRQSENMCSKEFATITIPQIQITPAYENLMSGGSNQLKKITHRGYSPFFDESIGCEIKCDKCNKCYKTKYVITRRGHARFGARPE